MVEVGRMAMPKKGSRSITVDGVKYRWKASGNDGYLWLFVELWEQSASLLCLWFDDYEPTLVPQVCKDGTRGLLHAKQGTIISSAVTAAAIRAGLRNGWEPNVRQPRYVGFCQTSNPEPWQLASHGEQTKLEQAELLAWMAGGKMPDFVKPSSPAS